MNYQIRIDVTKINKADLFVGEKGTYLTLDCVELKEVGKYNDTHLVKQVISSERYKAMSEEERKAVPILGNMKPKEPKATQAQEAAPQKEETPLPF